MAGPPLFSRFGLQPGNGKLRNPPRRNNNWETTRRSIDKFVPKGAPDGVEQTKTVVGDAVSWPNFVH